jgi:hypothetical protein
MISHKIRLSNILLDFFGVSVYNRAMIKEWFKHKKLVWHLDALKKQCVINVAKGKRACAQRFSHDFGAWSQEFESVLCGDTYVHTKSETRNCRDCGATESREIGTF